jgi:uncharacterized Fe-S cluster-containing radical SAM superfamily protein
MSRQRYSWTIVIGVSFACVLGFTFARSTGAQAQGQFPIMDDIANRIIQKYQNSTCEQLWVTKAEHKPPTMEEQRAIGLLKSDPQMRNAFMNRIAPPIANKMFDCGMIP